MKTIKIATLPEKQAVCLKIHLENAGIECALTEDKENQLDLTKNLFVNEEDVAKAFSIGMAKASEVSECKVRRILVPVVFKEYSLNICQFAIELAKKINAEINLFHVYKKILEESVAHLSFESAEVANSADNKNIAKTQLDKLTKKLIQQLQDQKINNVLIDHSIAGGHPTDEILEKAKEYNPHLIVVGTKGESKKSRALLGSTTTRIIEKVDYPVLAIPEDTKFKNLEELNVLYATDFNDSDFSSLDKLMFILSAFKAKVNCVHVEQGIDITRDKARMTELQYQIDKKYNGANIKCLMIHNENLFNGINEFIEKNKVDLISFTSPRKTAMQRLFTSDNLKKMFYYTNIPLLIFRAG